MRFTRYLQNRQPLVGAVLAIVLAIITAGALEKSLTALVHSQAIGGALARFSTVLLLLTIPGSIASPLRERGSRWWIVALVMTLLVPPRYLADAVDWGALQFSSRHAVDWLLRACSTGFFEEVLFRGVCFYILCRAWAATRSGLQKAAVVQALLFGALHLTSLVNRDPGYVLFQICFATVIGYSFAGLTAYARSLWPAIVLHAAINAAGSFDNHFAGPGYVFRHDTLPTMAAIVGAYLVCGALPGYWCLKRARLSAATTPETAQHLP